MIEQPSQVVGQVPLSERVAGRFGLPVAAGVPGDDPVPRPERLDLRGEHLVVHEQPVRQNDWRQVPASVLVVDPLAIDLEKRHRGPPTCRRTAVPGTAHANRSPASKHQGPHRFTPPSLAAAYHFAPRPGDSIKVAENGRVPQSELSRKLLIEPGHRILVLNPPAGYLDSLNPLPDGASTATNGASG